jgi:hypothetical protein
MVRMPATGRSDQLRHVRGEGQERAERDLVTQREPSAEGQDRDLRDRGYRLEQRLVSRLQPDGAHLRAVEDLCRVSDALELPLLLAERLDDANAVEILIDDLDEVALALLAIPRRRKDAPAHAIRHDQHARHDHNAHQRQQW